MQERPQRRVTRVQGKARDEGEEGACVGSRRSPRTRSGPGENGEGSGGGQERQCTGSSAEWVEGQEALVREGVLGGWEGRGFLEGGWVGGSWRVGG